MITTKFFVVFLLVAFVDFLWAQYVIHTANIKPLKSSLYATGIYVLSSLITIAYVDDHNMVLPAGLGAFFGTYLSVRLKKKS